MSSCPQHCRCWYVNLQSLEHYTIQTWTLSTLHHTIKKKMQQILTEQCTSKVYRCGFIHYFLLDHWNNRYELEWTPFFLLRKFTCSCRQWSQNFKALSPQLHSPRSSVAAHLFTSASDASAAPTGLLLMQIVHHEEGGISFGFHCLNEFIRRFLQLFLNFVFLWPLCWFKKDYFSCSHAAINKFWCCLQYFFFIH